MKLNELNDLTEKKSRKQRKKQQAKKRQQKANAMPKAKPTVEPTVEPTAQAPEVTQATVDVEALAMVIKSLDLDDEVRAILARSKRAA
jgi:hypothetical protein